ncbi:DUF4148 domain-containing protein [Rhodoferax sp. WC2427]|uniref:DUF4148 domain-containing protein n=1 Tax=Rhodoferax sp. WC2427 TaxID=3234144 RepID=UPI00346740DE
MNTTKLLAASLITLATVATTSAFADSYDREYPVVSNTHSTVTRAQVQAELVAAEKDGSLAASNEDNNYPVIHPTGTPLTRAEVRADLIKAEKDGSLQQFHD